MHSIRFGSFAISVTKEIRHLTKLLESIIYKSNSIFQNLFAEPRFYSLIMFDQDCTLRSTILEAYLSVLCLKEPPASVVGWTITALGRMFNALGAEKSEVKLIIPINMH